VKLAIEANVFIFQMNLLQHDTFVTVESFAVIKVHIAAKVKHKDLQKLTFS